MRTQRVAWVLVVSLAHLAAGTAPAGDRYVVKDNPGAAAPYGSWATAAADIQTAVDAAAEGDPVWVRSAARWPFLAQRSYRAAGDTVWVREGVYDTGGTSAVLVGGWLARWKLTNRVAIAKAIVVRSEHNDPARTIIRGAWAANGRTNGADAARCAYVADGAMLIGFTLTGGATLTTNEAWAQSEDRSGGGVFARSDKAVISNCIITGNSAFGDPRNSARGGAGACGGKFQDCTFTRNITPFRGGGADHSVLIDCLLAENAASVGGGTHGGILHRCVVSNNAASRFGGGVAGWSVADPCLVYDSVLVGNRASQRGGGAAGPARLERCAVLSNVASNQGAGATDATLLDCRVAGNVSLQYGSATNGGGFHNCRLNGTQ